MELAHKTTILLSPDLHKRLTERARQQHKSLGALIREACEATYFRPTAMQRLAAVEAMAALQLPVSDPKTMKQEAVQPYKPLAGCDDAAP